MKDLLVVVQGSGTSNVSRGSGYLMYLPSNLFSVGLEAQKDHINKRSLQTLFSELPPCLGFRGFGYRSPCFVG